MKNIVTSDLSLFGSTELNEIRILIDAKQKQGLPEDFYEDEVTIMFNTISGCVFFTNSDYQVVMMNGNRLELFYTCPGCGHEGFLNEMEHDIQDDECKIFLTELGIIKENNNVSR